MKKKIIHMVTLLLIISIFNGCFHVSNKIKIPVSDNENYLTLDDYEIILENTLKEINSTIEKSSTCEFNIDKSTIVFNNKIRYNYDRNAKYKYLVANNSKYIPMSCIMVLNEFNSKIKKTFDKNLILYKKEFPGGLARKKAIELQKKKNERERKKNEAINKIIKHYKSMKNKKQDSRLLKECVNITNEVIKMKKNNFETTKLFQERKNSILSSCNNKYFVFELESASPRDPDKGFYNYKTVAYDADHKIIYTQLLLQKADENNHRVFGTILYKDSKVDKSYPGIMLSRKFGETFYKHSTIDASIDASITNKKHSYSIGSKVLAMEIKKNVSVPQAKEFYNNLVILFAGNYQPIIKKKTIKNYNPKDVIAHFKNKSIIAYNKRTNKIVKLLVYNDKIVVPFIQLNLDARVVRDLQIQFK